MLRNVGSSFMNEEISPISRLNATSGDARSLLSPLLHRALAQFPSFEHKSITRGYIYRLGDRQTHNEFLSFFGGGIAIEKNPPPSFFLSFPSLLFPSLPPSTTHIYATTMTNNASGLIFIVLIFLSRETSCFFFFLSSRNDSQAVGALTRSKKRIRLFIIVKITSNVDMQSDKR